MSQVPDFNKGGKGGGTTTLTIMYSLGEITNDVAIESLMKIVAL